MITNNDIFFGANDHERRMPRPPVPAFMPIEWERYIIEESTWHEQPLVRWYRSTNWRVEEETPRVIIVDYNEQLR